jgi:PAS domain S-box-containing protein
MTEEKTEKLFSPERIQKLGYNNKSGRWQMMMIFCNGLILTITAFVTIILYMDRMRENAISETTEYFINDFNSELTDVARLFDVITETENIDSILNNSQTNKIIKALSVFSAQGDVQTPLYNRGLLQENLLSNYKNAKSYRINGNIDFFANGGNLYIFKNDNDGAIYAALLDAGLIQKFAKAERYKMIHRFRFFDAITNEKIIDYTQAQDLPVQHQELVQSNHTLNLFGHDFEIILEMTDYSPFLFGDKLPLIILLFGLAMTIIGTLFVRNNHNKAYQISLMNEILEEKNLSLENKIEEAEEISRALRDNEEEYKAVVNSVQDILFELDVTGNIVFLNQAWKVRTGIEIEHVYGDDLFKHLHPDDEERSRTAFFDFIKTEKSMSIPARIQTGDRDYRSVYLVFSVIRNDSSDIPHIIGTITDVEDTRLAEKALDEVEKRYRKIVENAAGGIYQVAPNGQVMSGNPSFARILGYDSMEQMHEHQFNMRNVYVFENDRKSYESELNQIDTLRNFEVQVYHKNGSVIWLNENARVVRNDDGDIQYYEGSIEEITQRKNAEMELMEAKVNSDLASRAKSEFLANMSHELRTPLNSIIGFSEIIKGEALGEIGNKAYVDYAKDIHDSGARLLSVINEILGISKIEAGNRQLSETIVDLKSVSQTCVDLLASKIEANKLMVNNLIDGTTPQIIAEELAFKQIVMNLLSNAIKFTPKEGMITIAAEHDEHDLRLSITDTGVGIDEADIPKALSPFGQIDNSLSRRGKGTGLGLTLVDSLVRLHGGRLEMFSQKGFGTTVTVIVPAKRIAVKKVGKTEDKTNIANMSDYKK